MKKEKPDKPSKEAANFVNAVQQGLMEMDAKLKEVQEKLAKRDQQINDMAVLLKSQQDQMINAAEAVPVVSNSEAGRDQPMTKNDFWMMVKEGVSLIRQQSAGPDPRIERALSLEEKMLEIMYSSMLKKAEGIMSPREAGVA